MAGPFGARESEAAPEQLVAQTYAGSMFFLLPNLLQLTQSSWKIVPTIE